MSTPSAYAAGNILHQQIGIEPYFPLAFATSPERPLEFDFTPVLDILKLSCPIWGEGEELLSSRGDVTFESAREAIR